MYFISLHKWKKTPTKEMVNDPQLGKVMEEFMKKGVTIQSFWTLGRYDAVHIIEAPSEKDAMKILLKFQDLVESETLTAVPRDKAVSLL
jgi:uncharacterized protein with GYD domain